MSRSNPPFYTGPDLGLPDADDFLHNPSGASSAIQVPGEESELANTDSKGTFLLDWNLHYDEPDASVVQENLGDSSLFSDLMVDFGNTGEGLTTTPFPSDSILELNSPGMEIFSNNEELLSPKRNSKLLPQFSGPTLIKTTKVSKTTTARKETKAASVLDCICNQPQLDRFILVCDKCDKWFHCECVGISQEQGEEMARERHIWLCPVCNESAVTPNKSQSKPTEVRSHIATRSQNKLELKVPVLRIPKKSIPTKEGKRCYLKSCQKRLANQNHHFCSNACIEVTVGNLKSFYQIKGLPSADSERVTLLDKSNMKILTGVSAPTLGGLAAWLKAHSTHVPIKPQPRQSQETSSFAATKSEAKMEIPFSNHEEIVRGKARKQLTDILESRIESSPDYAKYADSIPKVANQIEAQLYALDRSISTRYKNRYRSLSFSLRDSKNVGLYQRVVSGETPPEKLVQMSTEQLAPEEANSGKDEKNSSNSDISTTRSKTLDKQQSSVDYSSGEITRKITINQQKSQNPSKYVFEDKSKQGNYETKKSKSHANKSNEVVITPLTTTDVDIPPPKFSPTLSDSDEHSEVDKIVWKGSISMPNLAKCSTNGYLAYGPYFPEIDKILPSNVQVHGRIVYSMVWDYLKKIISSTTKGLVVLRLVPQSGEEEISFTTLFNYFHKRQRCGVAGGCTATVRDLYLLPFTKSDSVPALLSVLQGPGLSSFKTDTLLAMIVTNKPNESPLSTTAAKRTSSEIEVEARNTDQKANLTKPDYSSSLTNPSAPLPFSSIHSKTDLPFSSNSSKPLPDLTAVSATDNFAPKPFNPSGLYKPITETDTPKKDSYMIPYDKAESESSFNFGLGSKSTGDHIFPGLGEILKKSMDDPIIEDALSNLHFNKKPIKESQITTENTQKLHTDFGASFQDQFGYNNPPQSSYSGFPGTERQGDPYSDPQGVRPHPHTQRTYNTPHSDPNQDLEQFHRNQNYPYYGQEPINQSEHQLQPGQYVPGQMPPQASPHQEGQGYPNAPADYWQQFARDSQYKQKHEMPNPNHPVGYEGYTHNWQATQPHHGHEDHLDRHPAFSQESDRYPHNPNEQYHNVQKPGGFPPAHIHAEQAPQEHRLPYHPQLQEAQQHYTEHRQQQQQQQQQHEQDLRRPTHEYANQTQHVSEYSEQRAQREYPVRQQTGRYLERDFVDNEQHPNRAEESEKNRHLYPQHDVNEEGRDWRPPFEQLREEDKWPENDRRSFDKKNEKELAGRGDKEQGVLSWDLERARRDFRLDAEYLGQTQLEDRPLPPFLRRRLPLRTALSHHLDLARRELSIRGRGSPFGVGVRPSLLERDRIRLKREFPQEKEMLGAPLKLYRSMESPPKPTFEPITRPRATMRIRKRDRIRKSPKLRSRDGNEDGYPKREEDRLGKDESEPLGTKKNERRSRRRSRYSRNKDFDRTDETTAKQSEQIDKSPDKLLFQGNTAVQNEPVPTSEELYPQVVQEAIGNNEFVRKESVSLDITQPEIESKDIAQSSEEDKLTKFPPKHLQREKLLAMQEKLQSSIVPSSSPTVVTKTQERGEKAPRRRSRTRSREREHKGGRRRRSRSRERNRKAHSRDDIPREKEAVSLLSRERLLREREELPRRDTQPTLRERQLLALERERELLRVRARLALPGPANIDAIRERSPLRMADIDPRRAFVSPFVRARALDELRRERMDREVPGVFRGQYLYQDPRQ